MNAEWAGLAESAIRLTIPVLLVALGELISQRSGVINIGLEGMMSAGAYVGYVVGAQTGDPLTASLAAIIAGVAVAMIAAGFAVWGEVNQILVGFAIFILVPGLTGFLYEQANQDLDVIPLLSTMSIPGLRDLPFVGTALFEGNVFYWATVIILALVWGLLARTRFGLLATASGQNPTVAVTKGVPVKRIRTVAVLLCGALAGLGGAALTVGTLGSFSTGVTGGRGFIAIAIVILGRWTLGGVVIAGLAVGLADAVRLRLGDAVAVPVQVLAMIPWLVMLAMLIVGARWSSVPGGLGRDAGTDKD